MLAGNRIRVVHLALMAVRTADKSGFGLWYLIDFARGISGTRIAFYIYMAQILRGNFTPKKQPQVEAPAEDDLTTQFEREALKRLGGSIAFVSKKKKFLSGTGDGK